MFNHDKAFTELKRYYNDITAENLNLIKAQKVEIFKFYVFEKFEKRKFKYIYSQLFLKNQNELKKKKKLGRNSQN